MLKETNWATILTPLWISGSIAFGVQIYASFLLLIKLIFLCFGRAAKSEGRPVSAVLLILNVWLFVLSQGLFVGLFLGASITSDRDLEFLALPDRAYLAPVVSGLALLFAACIFVFLKSQLGIRWAARDQKLPDHKNQPVFRPRVRGRHAETARERLQKGQGQVPSVPGTRG